MEPDFTTVLEEVCARPIDADLPRLHVDAYYAKRRVEGRVEFATIAVMSGISRVGATKVLGVDVGDGEDPAFWGRLFLDLRRRGLRGVRLVTSEYHGGIEAAVRVVFPRARWECVSDPPDADLAFHRASMAAGE